MFWFFLGGSNMNEFVKQVGGGYHPVLGDSLGFIL